MLKKNIYLMALSCALFTGISSAATVEALVELQVGDKVQESTIRIDSEEYTQVSMKNESLGFALRLHNAQAGNERFETTPTIKGQPIARGFYTGKQFSLGAGCNLNGQMIEKTLIIKFLNVKHLS